MSEIIKSINSFQLLLNMFNQFLLEKLGNIDLWRVELNLVMRLHVYETNHKLYELRKNIYEHQEIQNGQDSVVEKNHQKLLEYIIRIQEAINCCLYIERNILKSQNTNFLMDLNKKLYDILLKANCFGFVVPKKHSLEFSHVALNKVDSKEEYQLIEKNKEILFSQYRAPTQHMIGIIKEINEQLDSQESVTTQTWTCSLDSSLPVERSRIAKL